MCAPCSSRPMLPANNVAPVVVGMDAYRRGVRVLREFMDITMTFVSIYDMVKLEAHILCASQGVRDEDYGVILAYEALVELEFNGEATQFRKLYYTTLPPCMRKRK